MTMTYNSPPPTRGASKQSFLPNLRTLAQAKPIRPFIISKTVNFTKVYF